MHISVCLNVFVCMYHQHTWYSEEDFGSPGTVATGGYELPCGAQTQLLHKSSKGSDLLSYASNLLSGCYSVAFHCHYLSPRVTHQAIVVRELCLPASHTMIGGCLLLKLSFPHHLCDKVFFLGNICCLKATIISH